MTRDLNRVNEAVQLAKALNSLMEEMSRLEASIEAAASTLKDLRYNREPDIHKLESLELRSLTGLALRMRLQGLLQVKQSRLHELKSDLRRDMDILRKISVCPYCQGSGETLSHKYERSEGAIHNTVQTRKCGNCNGTGIIELGPEVTRIMEAIKERIDDNPYG
jgi:hypothetical protein